MPASRDDAVRHPQPPELPDDALLPAPPSPSDASPPASIAGFAASAVASPESTTTPESTGALPESAVAPPESFGLLASIPGLASPVLPESAVIPESTLDPESAMGPASVSGAASVAPAS